MSLASSHPPAPKNADARPQQLCVMVGCHHLVCALPIRSIERLTLPEAAQRVVVSTARAGKSAGSKALPAVVQVAEERYAAWDLGPLLGLGPLSQAWVLLRVAHGGKEIRLALRTGTCLAVQGVPRLMKLPPGLFRARRTALTDGFSSATLKGARYDARIGLFIDPARLWEANELQASEAALARATGVAATAVREK